MDLQAVADKLEFVRTPDGWKSEHLVEEPVWFLNRPGG